MQCIECGEPLREGASFCGSCGHALAGSPPADTGTPAPPIEPAAEAGPAPEPQPGPTCPGCGKQVDERWRVCPYCKARLIVECLECDKQMERHWKMCPYCTTPLST